MVLKKKQSQLRKTNAGKLAAKLSDKLAGLLKLNGKSNHYDSGSDKKFELSPRGISPIAGFRRTATPNTYISSTASFQEWVEEVTADFGNVRHIPPSNGSDKLLPEMVDASFEELLLPAHLHDTLCALPTEKKLAMIRSSQNTPRSSLPQMGAFSSLPFVSASSSSNGARTSIYAADPSGIVLKLRSGHAHEMDIKLLQELRVLLKNEAACWTSDFLRVGGLDALNMMLWDIKVMAKRKREEEKVLQEILRCFKALLTHQDATRRILINPHPLTLMRNLLFATKPRADTLTKQIILEVFLALARVHVGEFNGHDLLFNLLADPEEEEASDEVRNKYARKEMPFPMDASLSPMSAPARVATTSRIFKAWMRELDMFVEQHFEPIAFLARALRYDFKSAAARAYKCNAPQSPQRQRSVRVHSKRNPRRKASRSNKRQKPGVSPADDVMLMVDIGVVECLVSHLQLIKLILYSPPPVIWQQQGLDTKALQSEMLVSGLDRVIKKLVSCPHPTLLNSYFPYLQNIFPEAPLGRPGSPISVISSGQRDPGLLLALSPPPRYCTSSTNSSSVSTPPSSLGEEKHRMWLRHGTIKVWDSAEFDQWERDIFFVGQMGDQDLGQALRSASETRGDRPPKSIGHRGAREEMKRQREKHYLPGWVHHPGATLHASEGAGENSEWEDEEEWDPNGQLSLGES
ncbi:uncharacterized protein VTP21DRAFT_3911 [Calcarisporiella thermophila]|uniref:uncharacterized protein n=1 Tax=Calcarisporiella thermophila TaxID=911321 RepID=UPI00374231E0